jgi:hypothetical protein
MIHWLERRFFLWQICRIYGQKVDLSATEQTICCCALLLFQINSLCLQTNIKYRSYTERYTFTLVKLALPGNALKIMPQGLIGGGKAIHEWLFVA